MSGFVRFVGSAAAGRGRHGCLCDKGPICLWLWLHGGWEALAVCTSSSAAVAGELGLQAPSPLGFWFSSVCSSPPMFRYRSCGTPQHPGTLGRDTFVELWTFYWLLLEGEKQREHFTSL